MWRLIVITFGFMGFAFYELSGGADYRPSEGSRQHAALQATDTSSTPLQPATTATAKSGGAQVVLASASSSDMAQPGSNRTTAVNDTDKRIRLTLNAEQTSPARSGTTHGVTTVAANPEKIARLVAAASVVRPSAQPEAASTEAATDDTRDLRRVKSTRVNMRQGPGKTFSVVTKLSRDTEVEVIRDNGDGWVKLRVLETGRVGWMADFLLVASN